jgi:perosamine synthetase
LIGQQTRIPWSRPDIGQEEANMIGEVLRSGWLSMGPLVGDFEKEFSRYVGAKHTVMVNNGTSALIAAYMSEGIKPGDLVLVPTYTFIATVNALLLLGAHPILMDVDKNTFNVSPEILRNSIKSHPEAKCAVIVDVAGMPCDLDEIAEICGKYSVRLIEDAAEAAGAIYKGKKVGFGTHLATFSFHAAKLFTSIEGGAITTNDYNLAETLRLIRNHGEDPKNKYWHVAVGLNLRPLEFQAALALIQLKKLDGYVDRRNKIAKQYSEELRDFLTQQFQPDYVSRHPYMIYLATAKDIRSRERILKALLERGVDYRIPWPPVHMQKLGYDFGVQCKVAEDIFSRAVSLPIFNAMTQAESDYVVDSVKRSA